MESLLASPQTAPLLTRERVSPLFFLSYTVVPLVQVRSSIVDDHDRVVATEAGVLDVAEFAKARAADYYVTLPLTTLAAGEYLLKVETTMGARTAGRAMRFVVK